MLPVIRLDAIACISEADSLEIVDNTSPRSYNTSRA